MHKYRLPKRQVVSWCSWSFAEQSISFNIITINSFTISKAETWQESYKGSVESVPYSVSSFLLIPFAKCFFSLFPFQASVPFSLPLLCCTHFRRFLICLMPPSSAFLTCISCEDVISFLPAALYCFLQQLLGHIIFHLSRDLV